MTYQAALATLAARHVPVGVRALLTANACAMVDDDALLADLTGLTWRGHTVGGVLPPGVGHPRAVVVPPSATLSLGVDTIPASALPAVLRRPFTAADASRFLDRADSEFLAALTDLWRSRVFGRGIMPIEAEQAAERLLAAGIAVRPVWPPTAPAPLVELNHEITAIVSEYTESVRLDAASRLRAVIANAARWNAAYEAALAIASAPQMLINAAAGGVYTFLKLNPAVLVGALAIGGLIMYRSKLLRGK